eukprot:Colp12_sorted_trinity150504_noHs@443
MLQQIELALSLNRLLGTLALCRSLALARSLTLFHCPLKLLLADHSVGRLGCVQDRISAYDLRQHAELLALLALNVGDQGFKLPLLALRLRLVGQNLIELAHGGSGALGDLKSLQNLLLLLLLWNLSLRYVHRCNSLSDLPCFLEVSESLFLVLGNVGLLLLETLLKLVLVRIFVLGHRQEPRLRLIVCSLVAVPRFVLPSLLVIHHLRPLLLFDPFELSKLLPTCLGLRFRRRLLTRQTSCGSRQSGYHGILLHFDREFPDLVKKKLYIITGQIPDISIRICLISLLIHRSAIKCSKITQVKKKWDLFVYLDGLKLRCVIL